MDNVFLGKVNVAISRIRTFRTPTKRSNAPLQVDGQAVSVLSYETRPHSPVAPGSICFVRPR